MSSHVPFLAIRPDDQFSTDVKLRESPKTNAVAPPALGMDSPPPLTPAPRTQASRIPKAIRFPLVCILSFSLSTILHSLTAEVSGFQLATASRALNEPWQIASLLGWKVVELATAWYAGYDCTFSIIDAVDLRSADIIHIDEDLAALTLLTNQPYYYLLHAFWSIQIIPVMISQLLDVAVITLPFALLRPVTRPHHPNTPRTYSQALATDWQIMVLTAGLAATLYAVTFYLSYYANLSVFLIVHFDGLPTLVARDSSIPQLVQLFVITGVAAMVFLFRPTIAAAGRPGLTEPKPRSRRAKKFNPETATLGETFAYNLGYGETGWSRRAQVLAKRTAVLVACTFANTFVRVFGTVEGTDIVGTLGYAGLWAGANVIVGVAYALLSQEE